MQRKQIVAVAFGLLVVLGLVQEAQARVRIFGFAGSRSQVAMACGGARLWSEGTDLSGQGYSMCIDPARGTSVVCRDNGQCLGFVPLGGGLRPRGPETAESLSSPSSNSPTPGGAYDYEVPLDPPTDGPIIIN